MGISEVKYIIISLLGIAMSLIGFVTVWVKFGHNRGKQEEQINRIEKKVDKNEQDISELKGETKNIQINIARHLGAVEAKIDFIKETVTSLKGGRRAAEE